MWRAVDVWRCDGAMCVVARSLGRAAPLLVLLTIVACQACSSQLDRAPGRVRATVCNCKPAIGFSFDVCASDRSRRRHVADRYMYATI